LGKQLYRLPSIGFNIITDVGQMKLAQPTGCAIRIRFNKSSKGAAFEQLLARNTRQN
jgi:hypothetical protein